MCVGKRVAQVEVGNDNVVFIGQQLDTACKALEPFQSLMVDEAESSIEGATAGKMVAVRGYVLVH